MYNSYMNKCKICQKDIRSQQQCCTLCSYCHDYHQNSQLPLGVCPKMKEFISLIRPIDHFPCPECEGQGQFTKITKVNYYQSTKRYESRVTEWERQNIQNSPKPQRKLLKEQEQQILLLNCKKCEGTGKINRIVPCKPQSCRKCLVSKTRSKLHINPHWAAIHRSRVEIQPINRGQICSACRRSVQLDGKRVKLPCGHIMHACCYEQMIQEGSCNICQRVISWRQVEELSQTIFNMRIQQYQQQQMHINDDSFCIKKVKKHKNHDTQRNAMTEQINNLSFKIQGSPSEQGRSSMWISSVESLRGYTDQSELQQQQQQQQQYYIRY